MNIGAFEALCEPPDAERHVRWCGRWGPVTVLTYPMMHPLHGTWIANLSKSTRHANHQFQNATMRFEIGTDTVVLSYEGVNASGKHESSTQTMHPDGQERPVPGAPGIVAVSTLELRRLEAAAKKDGVAFGRGTYEVDEAGKTLTATVAGIDASGKPFDQVIVFDRAE